MGFCGVYFGRNFRTMTADVMVQFSCVAVDSSGEIVCSGSVDPYNIYVWALKTGDLVDVLASHTAALSALSFSPVTVIIVKWFFYGFLYFRPF